MSLFPIFSSSAGRAKKAARKPFNLLLEALEGRALPSVTTISGYVYQDANNNGLLDTGEPPLANSQIQLEDSHGNVIGTTTTDANGAYSFNHDDSIQTNPATMTKTVTFNSTPTDFSLQGALDQFDPSLGTLTSIDIQHSGSITSEIKVENTSSTSTSHISGTVSGSLTLTGPGNLDDALSLSQYAGSYDAAKYDGTTDFGGTSGTSFGVKTANGSDTVTLTGAAMQAYEGTGQVKLTETSNATSSATGGGNLNTQITSTGQSTITVTYHYTPTNGLLPGHYTVVQTSQPAGYNPGKLSSNGTVLNQPVTQRSIDITLTNNSSSHNDFAELLPTSIAGHVYVDSNSNGVLDSGEPPIAGVTITLTGPGNSTETTTTDPSGAYSFAGLTPGVYSITETQPSGYLQGKNTVGSLGGSLGNDAFTAITVPDGASGINYNFGEVLPSTVEGNVYVDANLNGALDSGEKGIPGTTLKLTGTSDQGTVNLTTTTDPTGHYAFSNLRPGTYTVTETQPTGYAQGKNSVGSLGGTVSGDTISGVQLPGNGADAANYNFGEVLPASVAGYVFVDPNGNLVKDPGESGIPNVSLALTGTDALGNAVNLTTKTDSTGFYSFGNLLPGNYSVTETQPAGYDQGTNAAGNLGGTVSGDTISAIPVQMGDAGTQYNFTEIQKLSADLKIVKTANATVSNGGDLLTYTLSITNLGPNTAQQVAVTDNLPADVTFVSYQAPGFTETMSGQTLTFNAPWITAGGFTQITVTVKTPGIADTLTNDADVSSITPDPNPNNNTSTVTTTVVVPGNPGSQDIPALSVSLQGMPIIGKNQLFNDGGAAYIDPTLKGQFAFVDGVYTTLTGQSASPNTELAMVQALRNGTMTNAQFVNQVYTSAAHLQLEATDVYKDILNRAPSASELNAAVAQLQAGASQTDLQQQLLLSSEFQQLYPTSTTLAAGLYQKILGGTPGTTTSQQLVQSLGATPLSDVVHSLLTSNSALAQQIDQAYRDTVRRDASSAEIQLWIARLNAGSVTIDGISQQLLASSEFAQLAFNAAK